MDPMQNVPSSQVPQEPPPAVGTPRNEMGANSPEGHDHKSVFIILGIAVLLIVAAVGFWMYQNGSTAIDPDVGLEAPQDGPAPSVNIVGDVTEDDTTTTLEKELDGTNLGDLDKEFQEIDKELQQF